MASSGVILRYKVFWIKIHEKCQGILYVVPYVSWEFCWKMRFKQELQIKLYFVQKFKDFFIINIYIYIYTYMCLTFIRVISYSYTLHIPQGVHGANTWSSLDFEFEEDPNKTCCTSVLKRAPPNQNIFLCKILFPIEAILWKKSVSQKNCCNTSRSSLGYNEEALSDKAI